METFKLALPALEAWEYDDDGDHDGRLDCAREFERNGNAASQIVGRVFNQVKEVFHG